MKTKSYFRDENALNLYHMLQRNDCRCIDTPRQLLQWSRGTAYTPTWELACGLLESVTDVATIYTQTTLSTMWGIGLMPTTNKALYQRMPPIIFHHTIGDEVFCLSWKPSDDVGETFELDYSDPDCVARFRTALVEAVIEVNGYAERMRRMGMMIRPSTQEESPDPTRRVGI